MYGAFAAEIYVRQEEKMFSDIDRAEKISLLGPAIMNH